MESKNGAWAVRVLEIQDQPLEPVREHGEAACRPPHDGNAQGIERVRFGEEAGRVGELAVVRPVHRAPAMHPVVNDGGTVPDLPDDATRAGNDGNEQRRGVLTDILAVVSRLEREDQTGLAHSMAQHVLRLVDGGSVEKGLVHDVRHDRRGKSRAGLGVVR